MLYICLESIYKYLSTAGGNCLKEKVEKTKEKQRKNFELRQAEATGILLKDLESQHLCFYLCLLNHFNQFFSSAD